MVMSNEALNWAWKVTGLPSTQKFLLVALADFADEAHSCYPGQAKLAEMVGVHRQAVSRNLGQLEAAGFISRQRRQRDDGYRSSDRFVLAVGEDISCPRIVRTNDDDLMSAKTRSYVRETGGQEPSVEPSVNPQYPSMVSPAISADDDLDSLFAEAWASWPKRTERKKSFQKFKLIAGRHSSRDVRVLVGVIKKFGDAYAATTETRFVPALCVWLNGERWTDPLPTRSGPVGVMESARRTDEILRAREAARDEQGDDEQGELEAGAA